jgi:hypothetical protein
MQECAAKNNIEKDRSSRGWLFGWCVKTQSLNYVWSLPVATVFPVIDCINIIEWRLLATLCLTYISLRINCTYIKHRTHNRSCFQNLPNTNLYIMECNFVYKMDFFVLQSGVSTCPFKYNQASPELSASLLRSSSPLWTDGRYHGSCGYKVCGRL